MGDEGVHGCEVELDGRRLGWEAGEERAAISFRAEEKTKVQRDLHDVLERVPRASLVENLPPLDPYASHLPLLWSPTLPDLPCLDPNRPPYSRPLGHSLLVRSLVAALEPNEAVRVEPVGRCEDELTSGFPKCDGLDCRQEEVEKLDECLRLELSRGGGVRREKEGEDLGEGRGRDSENGFE